jgi:FAD/FMN-containing dehydrogenase
LLNITIRYVPVSTTSFLSYAQQESFSLVLYINVKKGPGDQLQVKDWTRQLIDAALACEGTYYLPYQLHATREQLVKAYPTIDQFFQLKRRYDPDELLSSVFYEQYRATN